MADFSPLKYAKALMGLNPSQGGLNYADYPNQYQNSYANGGGLRAWNEGNQFGGQMMPKSSGWQGEIPAAVAGYGALASPELGGLSFGKQMPTEKITEYSLGGDNGEPFFPSVAEKMTPQQIQNLRFSEAGLIERNDPRAQNVVDNAYENYLRRKSQGLSAFKDYN